MTDDQTPEPDETPNMHPALRLYSLIATGFAGFWIGALAHIIVG